MGFDQDGVLDVLPAMAWTARPDGSIDFVNRRWCDYFGFRSDEAHDLDWRALVHPDDLAGILECWQSILASGRAGTMETRLRRADGQHRRFLIQCQPMRDDTGQIGKWCGVATDIEDVRQAEVTSRQRQLDFQLVVDSIPMPVAVTSPSGEVEGLNQATLDYFGKTFDELKGWKASDVVHPDDLEHTIAAQLAAHRSGSPYLVESRHRRADGVFRWYSVHGLPLRDRAGQILRWLHLLVDIDDRKKADEALRESERNARAVVDGIPGLVAILTPDGKTDVVNQQMAEYHGLTPDELRKWATNKTIHDDDLPGVTEIFNRAIATGTPYEIEYRLRRFDGVYRWFYSRGVPLRDDSGRIACWYALQTDIDDRKQIEEALRESERNARMIVDGIPTGVAILAPTGEVERVNKPILEYFGKTEDEIKGWETADLVHPDDLPRVIASVVQSISTGQPHNTEQRLRGADGTYRWFYVHKNPVRDAEGRVVRWYALYIDIDEKKHAEQALMAREREARLIVNSIPAGLEVLSPAGKVEAINEHLASYFGKSQDELIDRGLTDLIHPDDLETVLSTAASSLATGKPYDADQRFRAADGTYRWFQVRGLPLRDADGNIVRWYALHTDIDDRKRAEQALAASERNLRITIDTIPALAWSARLDGTAEFLSKHYLDYTGMSAEEGRDWGWSSAVHPDDMTGLAATWQSILASGQSGEAEARLRRFDGEYRWFLFRVSPLRDDQGDIIKWYGVNTDIEDRKRAEQALAASERNLQITIDTIPAQAWSARPDGTVDFFSRHYLDYVGLTTEQAQDWAARIHPDDVRNLSAHWLAQVHSGKPGETQARFRRHDGEYRWFLIRVSPLRDDNGNIVKWYGINTDIEDWKRSEESFRAIVETTPECVKVVARDGTVLRTNAAGAMMAGVSSVDDVIGQRFFDFVAPEHRARYLEFHEKICAGQKGFLEFDLVNALGVRRHMETHAAPLRTSDGSIVQLGVTRDMTERKRAEDALKRSEAFLAEGQHLARMGNLSWNVTSGELIWSEQLHRIFEFEPGTVVTLDRIAGRVHPEDMPLMVDMVERAQRGESDFEYQHRIVLPDHSVKHLHLIAHRARDHTDQIEYIGAVLDITQRRLSEAALEKLRSELAQVTRIMSLGALTASIAHEVNQPLAGIITNAGTCLRMLAADPPNVDGARETARRTIRDGNRAADVIARLRALFSKKAVTIEPVDLTEAVREVIALLWSDLQRRRVVLHTELADGLPPVGGDRIQLQQVIMNLLRNAADAMNDVEDRPRRLSIRTVPDQKGGVCLSVRDTGVGFGPDGPARIFDAFYTTKSDGMGIGLSVSRSIIESHGGHLWAEANDGPGASFYFSVPEYSGDEIPAQSLDARGARVTNSAQNAAVIS